MGEHLMESRSTLAALFVILAASFTATSAAAAQKNLIQAESFPSAEGKRLEVDAADLDVRINRADVNEIEVDILLHIRGLGDEKGQRWIEGHTPSFTDTADKLQITVETGKSGFLGFGHLSARAQLSVLAPGEVIPDITTTSGGIQVRGDFPAANPLRLRTSSGNMNLNGATASLDIRTADGDAQIEVIRPLSHFFARTSSGDVRLVGGAREARVDTASGKISLENLSGGVAISTSTGRITISWDRLDPGQTVRIRSSSGRVHLMIPAGVQPQGTLTTTTGTIRSEFPGLVSEDGSALNLQGDGPSFDVETASGDIQLTSR
jgi:hypothetical protein